ncbi:hypothetical protein D3C71_1704800 [compost metagenome]
MGQAEVDGFHPVQVFLALADVRETPHAVVGFEAQLFLQRVDEGAEHVHQHALAVLADHIDDFHVDQRGEDDGLLAFHFAGVVDLAHGLVRLVHGRDKGNAHEARRHIELGHQGFAESFGGDAGAVGDQEYGARVHGALGERSD